MYGAPAGDSEVTHVLKTLMPMSSGQQEVNLFLFVLSILLFMHGFCLLWVPIGIIKLS